MHVITNKKEIEGITLKKFIEEKRLLKTKVKLLHILLLDEDIKDLSRECLTLTNLNLEDLLLTEEMHLIVGPWRWAGRRTSPSDPPTSRRSTPPGTRPGRW